MHAKNRSAVQVDLDVGWELREESLLRLTELRRGPVALVAQLRTFLAGQRRSAFEEPAVPVADDHRASELSQPLDRRTRLGPRSDVAETDQPVDSGPFEVLENRFERQ